MIICDQSKARFIFRASWVQSSVDWNFTARRSVVAVARGEVKPMSLEIGYWRDNCVKAH